MKKNLLLIALLASTLTTWAQTEKYDLNDDGKVNVADITVLVDYILTLQNPGGAPGDDDSNVSSDALVGTWIKTTNGGVIGIKFTADGKAYYNEWNVGDQHNFDNVKSPAQVTVTATTIKITHPQVSDYYEEYTYILSDDGKSVTFTLVSWNKDNHSLDGTFIKEDTSGKANVYTSCPDSNHPHWIDMGLPSGTQWRCCNEGASTPEAYGDKYEGSQVSSAPSLDQIKELLNYTTSKWTTQNGINGRRFTGSNGGTIFLPAAGDSWNGTLYDVVSSGWYWSSTPASLQDHFYALGFDSKKDADWSWIFSDIGQSVRPVR